MGQKQSHLNQEVIAAREDETLSTNEYVEKLIKECGGSIDSYV